VMNSYPSMGAEAYLIPYPTESFSKPCPIRLGSTSIGRDASNTIQISRESVCPNHAVIAFKEGRYVLEDLNSRKGTFVNERSIRTATLQHHDRICFGDRTFLFLTKSDPGTTVAALIEAHDAISVTEDPLEPSELMAQTAASAALGMFPKKASARMAEPEESDFAHQRLSLLYRLSETLRSTRSSDEILDKGLDLILEAIPSVARVVAILGPHPQKELRINALKAREPFTQNSSIPISRTIVDWVLTEKMALVSQNPAEDHRFSGSESIRIQNPNIIMVVPLMKEDRVMGMLYAEGRSILDAFTRQDLAFAAAAANEMALCMENIRLQKELIQNERMAAIGLMMTNLAHNIKNLLSLNQNALDLLGLQLRDIEDKKISRSWGYIAQSFTRINNLAVGMLAYAKEHHMVLAPTLINEVILSHRDILKQSLANKGIALELRLSAENPKWLMDANQFQRAFINLVVNAVDAVKTKTDGCVTITTHVDHYNRLIVSVTDNGTGIAAGYKDQIFDLFFSTKGTGGSGLGLPMVKKFVGQMGGELTVVSEEGAGSTFTMIFPESSR
jgi:two-component system, NtrC family, sensor kinase